MNNYILDRLRADAAHAISLAQHESTLQHAGLRGRFREILINNLLAPWLPPFCSCGTGMIIEQHNQARDSTQDDIIIYDESLAPPILKSTNTPEGVFLYNSVLMRLEVKSKLTRADLRNFLNASVGVAQMRLTTQPGFEGNIEGAYNVIVAFGSDLRGDKTDYELDRLKDVMKEQDIDPLSGMVSAICVVGRGFWKLGLDASGNQVWLRLDSQDPRDHLTWLVGMCSSTSFVAHARRLGRDPAKGVESGIGAYLPEPYVLL